ncbi:hypothetical protein S40285_08187 [Stachybotrys chlorohalonatus IBT 40285]|uniref:Zn(2)-C6 fungal-type domain-containing protein n=1 Tax=Stachybotrys chlorohalonatus (strain IBT 40285) TaxID=1283841 RepID=A0A084QWV3_STAC4|nr:hypothetical protein S40285_08187 [Stachybotrys chlorohalonata IBT 40285]
MTSSLSGESENRRTRKKSRTGCITCKKRHVKCDEARPQCAKCTLGDRTCSYAAASARRLGHVTASTNSDVAGAGSNSNSPAATPASTALLGTVADARLPEAPRGCFNAVHLALIYYAHVNMGKYMATGGDVSPLMESALDSALTAPYLLDQLLAVAALHRSTAEQARRSLFITQATELQTRALGQFNEARENINDANFMPYFLFASFLGIHVLRNTITDNQHDVSQFISAFVDYTRVHRGVRAVTLNYWDRILRSDLAPLLGVVAIGQAIERREAGTETVELRTQLRTTADPPSPPLIASMEALQRVQWVLDIAKHDPSDLNLRVHAAMAWPLVVSDEYIDALYQRRPEALAVLVYYLAVLHSVRDFWVFEACGKPLVESLVNQIGPFWEKALSWPLSMTNGS